jgi:hypothetical protein
MSADTNTSAEWVKSMAASLRDEDCGPAARLIEALAAERDALRHQMQIATTEQWHAGFEAGRADRDRMAGERDEAVAVADQAVWCMNEARADRDRLAADVARLRGALRHFTCPADCNECDGNHDIGWCGHVARAALGDTP